MKAEVLIKTKGLDYAKNIVCISPESALYWVEGYEFKCGQSANDLSDETKEKYFVSIPDLRHLVESHNMIESFGGLQDAKDYEEMFGGGLFAQAIADVESCLDLIKCWSCDKEFTAEQRSQNDGFCIHCKAEVCLD